MIGGFRDGSWETEDSDDPESEFVITCVAQVCLYLSLCGRVAELGSFHGTGFCSVFDRSGG